MVSPSDETNKVSFAKIVKEPKKIIFVIGVIASLSHPTNRNGHSCMKQEQNLNRIAKYLSDNSDSQEREELFAWVKENPSNKALLEESMELWEVAESSDLEFQPNMDAAWANIEKRLNQVRAEDKQETVIKPIGFFKPWMRIAAAILFLVSIAIWQYPNINGENLVTTETIAQEKTTIELPDGTKVWLNQKSSLQYEKQFDKRIVYLEGEAFFDVAKLNGKPFEIYAGASKTSVLGTSFNVRAYPDENKVEIAVETGKVAFSAENKPSENALLTPGEFAVYTKTTEKVDKLTFTKLNAAAWKKGALRFRNSQLDEVIESLERYYDIDIKVSNNKIYNCIWNNTKTFEKPVLEDLLKQISYTNNLAYKPIKDKVFSLSGSGCDK